MRVASGVADFQIYNQTKWRNVCIPLFIKFFTGGRTVWIRVNLCSIMLQSDHFLYFFLFSILSPTPRFLLPALWISLSVSGTPGRHQTPCFQLTRHTLQMSMSSVGTEVNHSCFQEGMMDIWKYGTWDSSRSVPVVKFNSHSNAPCVTDL